MGKPRMIILIRHAQSEGNRNRDIHHTVPDHRVNLTSEGQEQAEEAGRRLRSLLHPDDTIQFFTSPYRRTRETTEGILKSLTSDHPSPSPFPRNSIKVYEEPRLREQDFGNFQPCSAAMNRMWQERADYGHFFYRIPNGESAADAYDRISGFNESLWRQFGEENFPSVCVLVTHGLMTRVFLMKWYHWSVEYFEDLRNINHCEFIIMKHNLEDGKYDLENHLRTWSELHTQEKLHTPSSTPKIPSTRRRWGGCPEGCNHGRHKGSVKRKNALHPIPTIKTDGDVDGSNEDPKKSKDRVATHRKSELQDLHQSIGQMMARPTQLLKLEASKRDKKSKLVRVLSPDRLQVIRAGRDGGGSMSGANSQVESSDEEECYEEISDHENDADVESPVQLGHSRSFADALGDQSETDPDDDETLQVIRKLEKEEKSVQGSVY